jgi:hypothetical protein
MSNPIDAKAQIRMSMCPYSLIVSFSLHVFLGHLHSELKLLARAANYSKRYSHVVSVSEMDSMMQI